MKTACAVLLLIVSFIFAGCGSYEKKARDWVAVAEPVVKEFGVEYRNEKFVSQVKAAMAKGAKPHSDEIRAAMDVDLSADKAVAGAKRVRAQAETLGTPPAAMADVHAKIQQICEVLDQAAAFRATNSPDTTTISRPVPDALAAQAEQLLSVVKLRLDVK